MLLLVETSRNKVKNYYSTGLLLDRLELGTRAHSSRHKWTSVRVLKSTLAPGPWPLAPGPWPLAPGPWPLAPGPWPLNLRSYTLSPTPLSPGTLHPGIANLDAAGGGAGGVRVGGRHRQGEGGAADRAGGQGAEP